MAYLKVLQKFNLPRNIRRSCYFAYVFSPISFAWPVMCDLRKSEKKKLQSIHKRAGRLCDSDLPSLDTALDRICHRLAAWCGKCVKDHPLIQCFMPNESVPYNLRCHRPYKPITSKRSMLRNSFTKFANFAQMCSCSFIFVKFVPIYCTIIKIIIIIMTIFFCVVI